MARIATTVVQLLLLLAACDESPGETGPEDQEHAAPHEMAGEPQPRADEASSGAGSSGAAAPTPDSTGAAVYPPSGDGRATALAVGQWTVHHVAHPGGTSSELYYGIVAEEDGVFVVDVENLTPTGPMRMQLRILVEGDRRQPSNVELRGMRMRGPDGTVRGVPDSMIRRSQAGVDEWRQILAAEWEQGERNDVVVPAGTFRAAIRQSRDVSFGQIHESGTVWRHSVVPISGMVKTTTEAGTTVELVEFGTTGAERRFDRPG